MHFPCQENLNGRWIKISAKLNAKTTAQQKNEPARFTPDIILSLMCGRFTRKEKDRHLAEALKVVFNLNSTPSYNIPPSQMVACV